MRFPIANADCRQVALVVVVVNAPVRFGLSCPMVQIVYAVNVHVMRLAKLIIYVSRATSRSQRSKNIGVVLNVV